MFFNDHATRLIAMSALIEYAGVGWFDLKFNNEKLLNEFDKIIDNSVTEWKKSGDEAVANYGHITL